MGVPVKPMFPEALPVAVWLCGIGFPLKEAELDAPWVCEPPDPVESLVIAWLPDGGFWGLFPARTAIPATLK